MACRISYAIWGMAVFAGVLLVLLILLFVFLNNHFVFSGSTCLFSQNTCNPHYDRYKIYQYPRVCPDHYVYDSEYKLVKKNNFCCGTCNYRYCCADPVECLNQFNCELPWWFILIIVFVSCSLIMIGFLIALRYCRHQQHNKKKEREVVVLPRSLKYYSDDIINRSQSSLRSATSTGSLNRKQQQQTRFQSQPSPNPSPSPSPRPRPKTRPPQQQQSQSYQPVQTNNPPSTTASSSQLQARPQQPTYTHLSNYKSQSLRTIKASKSWESNKPQYI